MILQEVIGAIIAQLLADSTLTAKVSTRIWPDDSNLTSDSAFPCVALDLEETDPFLGTIDACDVTGTISVYSKESRDDALEIAKLVVDVMQDRITRTIDSVTVNGVLLNEGSRINSGKDRTLDKWYAEIEVSGKFTRTT